MLHIRNIIILLLILTTQLKAQSSLNWSLKSLTNNLGKLSLKNNLSERRNLFFQGKLKRNNEPSISFKSSAPRERKTNFPNKTAAFIESDDDLVIYDYSENSGVATSEKPKEDKLELEVETTPTKDYVFDYTITDKEVCVVDKNEKISHVSFVEISAESVVINKEIDDIQNFEINFFDDRDETITSNFDGIASFGSEAILARDKSSRQIQVYSADHYQVATKIDLSEDEIEYKIPLFSKNALESLLESEGIPVYEGLLLLALDQQVQNVFIDKPYKKRFYFSSDFKVTSAEFASFILYSGIELGNLELTIENNNETLHKSNVHLRTEEVYYYVYEKGESSNFDIQVCQQELLGSTKRRVAISGDQIELFGSESVSEKININKYRLTRHSNSQEEKDYLIFKHLSEDIMLSSNNANYVELPSQSFLNYLVNEFNLNDVHCMVQLNFTKPIKSVDIEGYTALGFLPMEVSYLDKSGLFDAVVNEGTEKAYVSAQGEGSIYTKISYANGSVDYVESFCGPGSYSIEQL